MKFLSTVSALAMASTVSATVYFKEEFATANWKDNWVVSDWKKSEQGELKWTNGGYYGDEAADKGLQTADDARFYAFSAKLPKEFSNKDKDLVLQYSVKQTQDVDCQGAYIKLLPAGLNQKTFGGDSAYNIMFGPDVCGTSTKRVHQIMSYKGENLLTKKDTPCASDKFSHVYTFIVHPDNTYETRMDGETKEKGNLKDDWSFLKPKTIKDPAISKPKDWVDEKEIADPADSKPSDWDQPANLPDPEASKPDDWDEEADGEWEAPTIVNPAYKGEWSAKRIPNPAYKGEWVHPEIANPEFVDDNEVYKYDSFAYVGFEVWQVKAGTIFDNIIVTDSVKEAEDFMAATFGKNSQGEKDMKKKQDDAKAEADRKKREADEAAKKEAEDDDDDDEEEEKAHEEL